MISDKCVYQKWNLIIFLNNLIYKLPVVSLKKNINFLQLTIHKNNDYNYYKILFRNNAYVKKIFRSLYL